MSLRNSITRPWIIIGDLNEVIFASEVQGESFLSNKASVMTSALDHYDMIDMHVVCGGGGSPSGRMFRMALMFVRS